MVDGLSKLEAATIVRDVGRRMKVGDVEVAYDWRRPPEHWTDAERWFWEP